MSEDGVIPCSPEEAVARMVELEASRRGCYRWGAGHYDPARPDLLGMTEVGGVLGWDCAGAAISHAYRLTRHRPGFNRQPHATVEDDINVDSLLEDADPDRGGRQELGELVTEPAPGVLILTPTIRIPERNFVEPGHVRMIVDCSRVHAWVSRLPLFAQVTYLECRGPDGRRPGVVRDSGESVDQHNAKWPVDFRRADGTLARPRAAMVRIRYRP